MASKWPCDLKHFFHRNDYTFFSLKDFPFCILPVVNDKAIYQVRNDICKMISGVLNEFLSFVYNDDDGHLKSNTSCIFMKLQSVCVAEIGSLLDLKSIFSRVMSIIKT